MKVLVLLFLSLVQGRGCDDFMKNVLKIKHVGFREVFPKNYLISHHYNDSILCDSDPCCVLCAAAELSESWSQLRSFLWKENIKYDFIMELQEKLLHIAEGKVLEYPDFPSVSSTPEALFNYTSALFST
ncbi:hypothetical protein AAFF_G00070320 [Aldrovandia affinis]|uniref:Uncharacterized protein n=1 Tax=Aldrovandia affinis TaxID=143900 RepID=A0AAD7RYS1_9TELE|nr:hypothetical protein AAFF_G00070320 [Aldrovandia affinis]